MSNIYRPKGSKFFWFRKQHKNKDYRKSLKTRDRGVAERRARKFADDLEATQWGEKPHRTFAETVERWVKDYLPTLKPRGRARYLDSLVHLNAHFGGMNLRDITSATLSEFETKRRAEGVLCKPKKDGSRKRRDIKPSSIRRDIACLSSMLTSAKEWEWLDGPNQATLFLKAKKKRGLKESDPRTRYLTFVEERILLAAASTDVADTMALAIDTGLRKGELFSLRWWQVNLLRGTITTTTKTKSGRSRVVPISDRAAQILSHLPRHRKHDYVLWNSDTGDRFIHRILGLKAAAKRAKIQDLCWHDLRRTAGCRWLQRDKKRMEEVSMLLGHSSVEVTEKIYAFLEAEAVAESEFGRSLDGIGNNGVVQFHKRKQASGISE